jgi:hypothetical protein
MTKKINVSNKKEPSLKPLSRTVTACKLSATTCLTCNFLFIFRDGGAYNRAITTIIRESYKKIEDFLLKQCNIKIHSLTSSEFSLVKTPLVHCRNILSDEDRSTFFKYIAITYKFGKMREDIFPTADETLRLYKAIVRGLNDRKAAKEMNPKPSKEKDMYFAR